MNFALHLRRENPSRKRGETTAKETNTHTCSQNFADIFEYSNQVLFTKSKYSGKPSFIVARALRPETAAHFIVSRRQNDTTLCWETAECRESGMAVANSAFMFLLAIRICTKVNIFLIYPHQHSSCKSIYYREPGNTLHSSPLPYLHVPDDVLAAGQPANIATLPGPQ